RRSRSTRRRRDGGCRAVDPALVTRPAGVVSNRHLHDNAERAAARGSAAAASTSRCSSCAHGEIPAMTERSKYWFPAKRYGWGWGPPTTWQGWVVLAAYVALVAAGIVVIGAPAHPAKFIGYLVIVTALLIGVCWMTGEPPRWRWGERDDR